MSCAESRSSGFAGRRLQSLVGVVAILHGIHATAASPKEPLDATQVLESLAEVEAEARRISPDSSLQTRSGELSFAIGSIVQGVTPRYQSPDMVRYAAMQLRVVNRGAEAREVDVTSIRLHSGDLVLSWKDRPASIDGASLETGTETIMIRDVRPPDTLTVPGGGAASTWLLFTGLDFGAFVPEMTLEIPTAPEPLELDLNLYERAVLRMTTRQLGPADCLAIVTISGTLNTVNAGALAAELERMAQAGVHRAVIAMDPAAPPLSAFLDGWLREANHPNPYRNDYKQMPGFPGTLQELRLVIPGSGKSDGSVQIHESLDEAVTAALRTAFELVAPEEVVAALRSDDAHLRIAALKHGADRLRPQHLPLVLRSLEDPSPLVQSAALTALGSFSSAEAIESLVRYARGPQPELAAVAVRSLASSRFPQAHDALGALVGEGLPLPPQELLKILSAYPRPQWRHTFLELTSSPDSRVQQAALQALARLGHPQLMEVLVSGLESSEPRVREEAFRRLSQLRSREADEIASQYALSRLATEPPSGSIHEFLARTRDQRAIPLLISHLDGPEGIRRNVIELLAEIGDQSVGAEIAARYDHFTDSEKVIALSALEKLRSPLGRSLAMQALHAEDVSLVQRGVEYLKVDGSEDAVREMTRALGKLRGAFANSRVHFLCNGLGSIGTPAARDALMAARKSSDEQVRTAAQNGLYVLWSQSPARDLIALGERDLDVVQNIRTYGDRAGQFIGQGNLSAEQLSDLSRRSLESAKTRFEAAARLDPGHPQLALDQGQLLHLLGDSDAAVAAFRRAIELNSEFIEAYVALAQTLYDAERFEEAVPPLKYAFEHDAHENRHQWLTTWSLSLLRLGRLEEGLTLVRRHADEFPEVPVFEYNLACIYSRAFDLLREDPNVASDDPRLVQYPDQAVDLLKASFEHDIASKTRDSDMYAYMRDDPDLVPLHDVPAFREFAELDVPEEQRRKAPPQSRQPLSPPAPAVNRPPF